MTANAKKLQSISHSLQNITPHRSMTAAQKLSFETHIARAHRELAHALVLYIAAQCLCKKPGDEDAE